MLRFVCFDSFCFCCCEWRTRSFRGILWVKISPRAMAVFCTSRNLGSASLFVLETLSRAPIYFLCLKRSARDATHPSSSGFNTPLQPGTGRRIRQKKVMTAIMRCWTQKLLQNSGTVGFSSLSPIADQISNHYTNRKSSKKRSLWKGCTASNQRLTQENRVMEESRFGSAQCNICPGA